MAGNKKSGGGPKFRMEETAFDEAVKKYMADSDAGLFPRPSLSHFCAKLGTTETYLQEWLDFGRNQESAYYKRAERLKIFLAWLRGEMFSSGKYDNPAAKKYVEMQLGRDHGDGVTYSDGASKAQGVQTVIVDFGGNDPRAKSVIK